MRKAFLSFLLFLVFTSVCIGSEYDFNTITEFNSNVKTGENYIGRVVFTKFLTNFSTFNSSLDEDINISVGDRVCNVGGESFNILNTTLLSPNNCFTFVNGGVFVAESVISNKSSFVIVDDPVLANINIDTSASPFTLIPSVQNFSLDNDTEVRFNISLPEELIPSNYKLVYYINNERFEHSFNVDRFIYWNASLEENNLTAGLGTSGVLTNLQIFNEGNSFTEVSISKYGNGSDFLLLPVKVLVYSGTDNLLDVSFSIPKETVVGSYKSNIVLEDEDGKAQTIPLRFIIVDDEPPSFGNLSGDTDLFANQPFNLSVNVFDNAELTRLGVGVWDESGGLVFEGNASLINDRGFVELVFGESGIYNVELELFDSANNSVVKKFDLFVDLSESIEVFGNVDMYKQKVDVYLDSKIAKSDHPNFIRLKLVDLIYGGDYNLKVVNGETTKVLKSVNDSVEIEGFVGNLSLFIKGSVVGDFYGKLELSSDENHISLGDVEFSGEFLEYEVPEGFEEEWYGNLLSCDYVNVNDVENHKTICTVTYVGELIPKSELTIPTTSSDREYMKNSFEESLSYWKSKNISKSVWIWIFTILLFISVLLLLYHKHFYGKVRFTWRTKI